MAYLGFRWVGVGNLTLSRRLARCLQGRSTGLKWHTYGMAARDRYHWDVSCPTCGTSGRVHVSEDDHPYITNPHFAVDDIDGPFRVHSYGRTSTPTEIACVQCGRVVKG